VERNVLFLIIAYMRDYKYVDKTKIPIVENILNVKIGINMVLVKPLVDNSVLDNGLYMDTSFREIDCANRIVEVIKTPLILAIKGLDGYDERNYRALDWGTVMELKVGDKAWVDPLYMVLNNHTNGTSVYQCDDELYYVVPYDKFIVAKRECNINFSETTEKSYDGEKSNNIDLKPVKNEPITAVTEECMSLTPTALSSDYTVECPGTGSGPTTEWSVLPATGTLVDNGLSATFLPPRALPVKNSGFVCCLWCAKFLFGTR
jgi:hypothetical protein